MEEVKVYHINNSSIRIIFGNILDSQADVIVNSSGSHITMGGGLTKAIRDAGGDIIRDDAQKQLPVNIGDVVVSTAGKLHQKYVFHCVTIDKSFDHSNTPHGISGDDIPQYVLGHSIDKCFQILHALEISSIAFPTIGAGEAAIPFENVSKVMAEVIARNLRKTNKAINIEIYLYDRLNNMKQWDFLPIFEHFSSQEALSNLLLEQTYNKLTSDENERQQDAILPDIETDVFISYSRKDKENVLLIYELLKNSGVKCWLDIDGMYSGVSYKKVIVDAIKKSKVLLFMSSENSNSSQNVISEVALAVKYGKKVIPVRLDFHPYSESIEYDIINHDYIIYDKLNKEKSFKELLKKLFSTLEMV